MPEASGSSPSAYVKFRFAVRTRTGSLVNNLLIAGTDQADAERRLRQMYLHCEILECIPQAPEEKRAILNFEEVANLLTRY